MGRSRSDSSRAALSFEDWSARVATCRAEVIRLKQEGYPHEIDAAVAELVAAEALAHADPVVAPESTSADAPASTELE